MTNNGHTSSRQPLKRPVTVKDKKYPMMYRIQFDEGGQLHESLSGMFSLRGANEAIEKWFVGTTRRKIYPQAPKNDIPQRIHPKDTPKEVVDEPSKVEAKAPTEEPKKRKKSKKVEKNGEEKGIS